MVELADIFRRYGPDYIERFGSKMLASHRRALHDIVACRTEQMGGHLYRCENADCEQLVYAYHSCGNRSCPKCGQDKTQFWIEKQHNLLAVAKYLLGDIGASEVTPAADEQYICPLCGAKLLWVKPLPKSTRAPP